MEKREMSSRFLIRSSSIELIQVVARQEGWLVRDAEEPGDPVLVSGYFAVFRGGNENWRPLLAGRQPGVDGRRAGELVHSVRCSRAHARTHARTHATRDSTHRQISSRAVSGVSRAASKLLLIDGIPLSRHGASRRARCCASNFVTRRLACRWLRPSRTAKMRPSCACSNSSMP